MEYPNIACPKCRQTHNHEKYPQCPFCGHARDGVQAVWISSKAASGTSIPISKPLKPSNTARLLKFPKPARKRVR